MRTIKIGILVFYSIFPIISYGEILTKQERVKQHINDRFSSDEPGIQYVVVSKDSYLFKYSFGVADIKNIVPISLGHTMSAFSMTKTLTAIAILQLVERNKLDLNSPALRFVNHPYNADVTIKQLLSHTAGIPNPIPLKWVHFVDNHEKFDEKGALSKVLSENPIPDAIPGEQYGYSNIGYWLLGAVVEKISGQKFEDYIKNHIFQPLGLTVNEIGFQVTNENNQAKGYLYKYSLMNLIKYFVLDKQIWGEYEGNWLHINTVYLNGPSVGGAIGSSIAFSRILQNLLLENSVLLGESVKQYLFAQQKTKSGRLLDMTLGFHVGEIGDVKFYYKEGGGAGFHCEMRLYPDYGIASVIMVNRTSFDTSKLLSKLDFSFISE